MDKYFSTSLYIKFGSWTLLLWLFLIYTLFINLALKNVKKGHSEA